MMENYVERVPAITRSSYMDAVREELSLIADGIVVKYAVVAGYREGVIAYWPPETPMEVFELAENIYLKTQDPCYAVIEPVGSPYKYLLLHLGDKIILLTLDKRVEGEELGRKILMVLLASSSRSGHIL
ncbi:MAG: hypothetical protein ACP5N5_06870 [Desulfurococcus sp.]|uniref:hypothetical protein n=2 Tax=Desulfurococcus TaxID=2273 RepID=UPI003D1222CD